MTKSLITWLLLLLLAGAGLAQPEVGEKESYSERAERALVAGDYESAVELYRRWLEADPDDFRSWYNYACALALRNDTTAAIQALETATEMGWRDSTWTVTDPDLSMLHDHPTFVSLMKRMGELWRREQARVVSDVPRYTRQVRYAPYMLHLPHNYQSNSSQTYPLLVLLHGRGGDMTQMTDLRRRLALPNVIVVQPQAPYAVTDGMGGFEYWPSRLQNEYGDTLLAAIRENAGRWVADVIDAVIAEARVDTAQVFVVGFSQGAAAGLLAASRHPERVRGLALLGGYIPETHRDSSLYHELGTRDVAVFIAHGRRDRTVEPREASALRDSLVAAGVSVEMALFPAEHEISDEMVVAFADWYNRIRTQPRREVPGRALDSGAAPEAPLEREQP